MMNIKKRGKNLNGMKKMINNLERLIHKRYLQVWYYLSQLKHEPVLEENNIIFEEELPPAATEEKPPLQIFQDSNKKTMIMRKKNISWNALVAKIKKSKGRSFYNYIYSVILLQRDYRRRKYKSYEPLCGIFEETEEIIHNAQLCELCEKRVIERICGTCEIALFCGPCYADVHKKTTKRNHKFLKRQCILDLDNIQGIFELMSKYHDIILDIAKHFGDWDLQGFGILEISVLVQSMKRKIPDDPFAS